MSGQIKNSMKLNLNIQPLNTWIKPGKEPLVIAGPCSAETEDQLVATAQLLAATGRLAHCVQVSGNHVPARASLKVLAALV
jgi:3-deoxy-D-arabino-heptulosonate 7-phosphate (DAHP) synthase